MASYYRKVEGTLEPGKTARSDDIHLIQSAISDAVKELVIDICGEGCIVGEAENAFQLYGTNLHTDQSNLNYNPDLHWVSFYDRYFKQPIEIKKSSIDSICVDMINDTNISTVIYAEIRDNNSELLKEANAELNPTPENSSQTVEFNFNLHHLPLGIYNFIIRPVDISSTDLAMNNDEVLYNTPSEKLNGMPKEYTQNTTQWDTILPEHFCVRYDADGNYELPLEVALDGVQYVEAQYLDETLVEGTDEATISDIKPCLYFEEKFSKGSTYLVDNECVAIIQGERVTPVDTHITIDEPSYIGNRIDIVSLNKDGEFIVTKGTVFTDNEEKIYPVSPAGNLDIAYITNYPASKNKVPAIEQDDTNNTIRQRDILERLRRLEKYRDYQDKNNTPTRVIYNLPVDPILEVDPDKEVHGEGSYGIGTHKDGSTNEYKAGNATIKKFAWSIIEDNYTYNVDTKTSENCKIEVWNTHSTPKKDSSYTTGTKGLYHYYAEVTDHSKKPAEPIHGIELTIQIKKGGTLKKTFTKTTNKNGIIQFTLFSLKLAEGSYTVYTSYKTNRVKSKLVINKSVKNHTEKSNYIMLSLPKVNNASVTHKLPKSVRPGNDSFETDNIDVDTKNGEVRIKKISQLTDNFEINEGRKLLKDTKKVYDTSERIYNIKPPKGISTFPAINILLDRATFIKSITPYIAGFKNIQSFGILIFKNNVIQKTVNSHIKYKKAIKKTYHKRIGAGKINADHPDDANFPTLYKSKYISLKDIVKKSGNYKVLKEQVTFNNINLDLEPGAYTIMICPKLQDNKKNGEIKIKQYHTKRDSINYGMSTNIYGSSKLSRVSFDNLHTYDDSWDIEIKHKTYQYYEKGTLRSQVITVGETFSACNISRNFVIPKNCDIKLYVSNSGGASWVEAKNNHIEFDGSGSSFQWMIELIGNTLTTPKLKFNTTKKNAISFDLAISKTYVPYEDYNRCYESPLINANHVTRGQIRTDNPTNTFTAWEFARVFMEDTNLNSKIDVLISYSDDYHTLHTTPKDDWDKSIFFSTVFADLTLDDFSQESINYDNYDGNVEYDEHNYKFNLKSDEMFVYTGGLALASPDKASEEEEIGIFYGNINPPEGTQMSDYFTYQLVDVNESPYEYRGNEDNPTRKYSGMHITNGPYMKATRYAKTGVTGKYTTDDTIIGVRFNDGLDVDENMTNLAVGLMPHIDSSSSNKVSISEGDDKDNIGTETDAIEKHYFPAGTFKIAISLGRNGEINSDATEYKIDYATVDPETQAIIKQWEENQNITINSSGVEYVINKDLYSDEYTEVNIDLTEHLAGFQASGIHSIAIKAANVDVMKSSGKGDYIGLGRISTTPYNIRAYAPYTYTGSYKRFQWENIVKDSADKKKTAAFAMCALGTNTKTKEPALQKIFYPIDNEKDINGSSTYTRTIKTNTEQIEGKYINRAERSGGVQNVLQVWTSEGTSRRKVETANWCIPFDNSNNTYIKREGSKVTTHFKDKTFVTTDTGNQTLFCLPKGVTGNIFKINVNIPYTIYDLIDIEYYIFTRFWKKGETGCPTTADASGHYDYHKKENGNVYFTDGSFSKGEIYIDFYDSTNIENRQPMESFALPSWGRIATRSEIEKKVVYAWFKKRSTKTRVRSIVLRRENPRGYAKSDIKPIKLMLNNIIFFNTDQGAALGPQMQLRIYPNDTSNMSNTSIRKIGGVYRI